MCNITVCVICDKFSYIECESGLGSKSHLPELMKKIKNKTDLCKCDSKKYEKMLILISTSSPISNASS